MTAYFSVPALITGSTALALDAFPAGNLEDAQAMYPEAEVVAVPKAAKAGWVRSGATWVDPTTAPPAPVPVPDVISDRQFAQQAAIAGLIDEDEALAWVGPGTIPATMLGLVDQLPEAIRFGAKMMLTGATTYDRTHALTEELVQAFGWSDEERDAFWTAAAAL